MAEILRIIAMILMGFTIKSDPQNHHHNLVFK